MCVWYSGRGEPEPRQADLREDDLRDVHGGDRQTGQQIEK